MSGEIDRVHTLDPVEITGKSEDAAKVAIMLVVSVRNSGTPSIADEWSFTARLRGRTLASTGIHLMPQMTFNLIDSATSRPIQYSGSDALYEKTVKGANSDWSDGERHSCLLH